MRRVPCPGFFSWRLASALVGGVVFLLLTEARAAEIETVFSETPISYQENGFNAGDGAICRTLRVEERTGEARRAALVRVPLFFTAGECATPAAVAVVATREGARLVQQADDVRTGPDGGVSRMHLWFEVDLGPWERKTFLLVKRNSAPVNAGAMRASESGDNLRISTKAGEVVIARSGPHAGALLAASLEGGGALTARDGLMPRVVFAPSTKSTRGARIELPVGSPKLEWAAGPLFTKVRARWSAANGAMLEQIYRVDRQGHGISVSQTAWPGDAAELAERALLTGSLDGVPRRVMPVPAGLRREFRSVHPYTVSALVGDADGPALLAVPVALGGGAGQIKSDGAHLTLSGAARLSVVGDAPAGTLRAFWTEVEIVGSPRANPEMLWASYHAHVQPLVAVVDEPAATPADLSATLRQIVGEMQPIGWRQEAGRFHVLGKMTDRDRVLANAPKKTEADPANLERGAQGAWKTLSGDGKHTLREDEKSRASGPIDPYHLTYTQSAAAALAALNVAPPNARAVGRANAVATRAFLGRADENGFPYVDCFNRAFNMQLGPMLFGLVEAKDDAKEAAFYRDLANAPTVRAVYGRAQRPYSSKIGPGADYSDHLYQAICDFWLRATELLAGENLEIHPLAYARYTDCVDVLADRYHGFDFRDTDTSFAKEVRANFWRAQPHTHRWLVWSASPFMRLLEAPGDNTGLTEAARYCHTLHGRWKNWPDLTFYELAEMLTREALPKYQAPALLTRPTGVKETTRDGGREINWGPVVGATSYRVYRMRRDGGVLQWLNSPYGPTPAAVTEAKFFDREGRASDRYTITAVDAAGRESRWFDEAPALGTGHSSRE